MFERSYQSGLETIPRWRSARWLDSNFATGSTRENLRKGTEYCLVGAG